MRWPLAVSNFTVLDKLKIGGWLLTENHWSQGEWVRKYEKKWEAYTGAPHVIMVSSGSAANQLISQYRKYNLQKEGMWPHNNRVLVPAVNWVSAVSPWVNQGFRPVFMDVGSNLCSTGDQVAAALEKEKIGTVFYTTLLGISGGLHRIKQICDSAKVPLLLDNCESSFSIQDFDGTWNRDRPQHFCNFVTCSTSLYFSHHTSGNQEGGLIFCQDQEEADWYRMARNHGLTRGVSETYRNKDVHPHFDFFLLGSNHRSSNLIAYMAGLDFNRALGFSGKRRELSELFSSLLDPSIYEIPHRNLGQTVPFSFPIIVKDRDVHIAQVRSLLDRFQVEHRPIVGGNLLRHTAFRPYGDPGNFPRAQHIHDNGVYIGLQTGVTQKMVQTLVQELNRL